MLADGANNLEKKPNMPATISHLSEDLIENIFSRLPAPAFCSSACVNKCWNKVCGGILKRPKLATALSLKPDLQDAVNEVLDKVLADPIVPHFAIACIGKRFSLEMTHQLLTQRFGPNVPVITNVASGIIGEDAATNKIREVRWESSDDEDDNDDSDSNGDSKLDRGIVLVIGFVPGLKVEAIPLLRTTTVPQMCLVENFLRDIKTFTAFFQDSESPSAIIMFGDQNIDMKPVLAMMDYALNEETVIVGDASGNFLYKSAYYHPHYNTHNFSTDAVALVFARNRYKSPDIGETEFHVNLSTGIMPFGPQLQAVCVLIKDIDCSLITARAEGQYQILDGEGLLDDINSQFEDEDESPDLYIGVVQFRNYASSSNGFIPRASLSFYKIMGSEDRDFLIVNGIGIQPRDYFLFYHSDADTASASCSDAYKNLKALKEELEGKSPLPLGNNTNNRKEKEVLGGLIFSSFQRGKAIYPDVDSSPFHENFPEAPLAGVFCSGEIGRGSSSSMSQEDDEATSARCCLHYHSAVYLALSYTPPSLEH